MSGTNDGAPTPAQATDTRITDADEVMFRQIHPDLFLNGTLASSAFQPSATDEGQMSVNRSSLTNPKASFDLYVANGRLSRAVYGVSVGEFGAEGVICHSDPLAATPELMANPAHAYADYNPLGSIKAEKKKAQKLRDKAVARGHLHR